MQAAEQLEAAEKLLAAEQRWRWWTPLCRDSAWNAYPSSHEWNPWQANKQSNLAWPANWHDTPGQYIECTCKLTITRSIQDKQQHGNYRLSRNYHDIIRITWHEQHEHDTAKTIWAWHEHINLTILACNMMTLYAPLILLGLPRNQHMHHLPTSYITRQLRIKSCLV